MLAIGLMSGTSLDGVDAALIETDGDMIVRPLAFRTEPWSDTARAQLQAATRLALTMERPREAEPEIVAATTLVDRAHIMAVRKLIQEAGVVAGDIELIGYHGQTVAHRPERGWTWQIGDGAALARALSIPVVNDFRRADVEAGGQGAPLIPSYHRALAAGLPRPVAFLNIGGVANMTWVAEDGTLTAFDSGPGNGLIDAWMEAHGKGRFDPDGATAATGTVDEGRVRQLLADPYFGRPAPKSLDRHAFTLEAMDGLSLADGAATLTAFTVLSVVVGLKQQGRPKRLIVAGGGRRNRTLMRLLAEVAGCPVEPIEAIGCDGDATEAEGFAYLAVRAVNRLPFSFPGTTGVPAPMHGGMLHTPR